MTADLISEGTLESLESARARGRSGDRPPALTEPQVLEAREMYDELDVRGKHKCTLTPTAGTFAVSRKTPYRHLDRDEHRTG
ncbi:hypothetical protein [Nocardia xishanensis]